MTADRIKELALEAFVEIEALGTGFVTPVTATIERAIKTALIEAFSEPATSDMQIAGYKTACSTFQAKGRHDVESHIYAAMCAEKAKQWK